MKKSKKCTVCNSYIPWARTRKGLSTCSNKCDGENIVSPATVGAIAEFLVSVDLMKRGYDVYKALSPAASCDLVIVSRDFKKVYRVEVKSGQLKNGRIYPNQKSNRFDILAVVIQDKVIYQPEVL